MIELKINEMAARQGLSAAEVLDRMGYGDEKLKRIERNEIAAIRYSTLDNLCRILECEPGDLLKFTP